MYQWVRPALFALDAECAHDLTLAALSRSGVVTRNIYGNRVPACPTHIMGLELPNPVGLAAGLDKNGVAINALAGLGFGFIEIGTVTPRPQPGNSRPRLFRLPEQQALINRLGFNNDGVEALRERVRASRHGCVLGINIGRNADTLPEQAIADYLAGLAAVYELASYITVNISSPNTKGLRDLQADSALDELLGQLMSKRDQLAQQHGRRVPLAVKIAPDLDEAALAAVAERLVAHGVDCAIATNTTIERDQVPARWRAEAGGLSGAPLATPATRVIRQLAACLDGAVPIIGVGGIVSGEAAVAKLEAGASAVQIYSGLVYRGPALIRECVQAIRAYQAA
ncbi:MAG TPA: quinone-dependent dihydroorotate dehydrogenase [Salinisphaeraceae bacterium]|nr:quinone-dependent dihydroorotate dehydrogenase [Salinisphaeraceae bacterium]